MIIKAVVSSSRCPCCRRVVCHIQLIRHHYLNRLMRRGHGQSFDVSMRWRYKKVRGELGFTTLASRCVSCLSVRNSSARSNYRLTENWFLADFVCWDRVRFEFTINSPLPLLFYSRDVWFYTSGSLKRMRLDLYWYLYLGHVHSFVRSSSHPATDFSTTYLAPWQGWRKHHKSKPGKLISLV